MRLLNPASAPLISGGAGASLSESGRQVTCSLSYKFAVTYTYAHVYFLPHLFTVRGAYSSNEQ